MSDENETTGGDCTTIQNERDALLAVAQVAAMCCLDLDANLHSADKEHMAGAISNGAFQHVLDRHTRMRAALYNAGFTEQHPIFGWPMRPDSE